jgi:hypothetical protein
VDATASVKVPEKVVPEAPSVRILWVSATKVGTDANLNAGIALLLGHQPKKEMQPWLFPPKKYKGPAFVFCSAEGTI